MFELEKVRMNYEKPWVYTTIQESNNEIELLKIAKETKIKFGKTFEEKLVLNHIDEHGDTLHVDALKYTSYDHKNKLKPYIVDSLKNRKVDDQEEVKK